MNRIAVLLTCFNRKDKTVKCLSKMYEAVDSYNKRNKLHPICVEVFLVDDGCTDGTAEEVQSRFYSKSLKIIKGDGTLFWAGGMRRAWAEAHKRHSEWTFYLLLNDDTYVFPNLFDELFQAHKYSIANFQIPGIYSGITRTETPPYQMTYGGSVWTNKWKGLIKMVAPTGTPQICDMVNANILMIHTSVVDVIGMFSADYQHCIADYDYGIRARKKILPVLVTAGFCGVCENDHQTPAEIAERIINMTLKERIAYFQHPIHSNKDYLRFISNTSPIRLPIVWFGRWLNVYCPRLYYWLSGLR